MLLNDKIIIITGGGGGLGVAMGRRLSDEGAKVIVADIQADSVSIACKQIEEGGGTAVPETIDVSKVKDVNGLLERTVTKFERVDVLIHAAGVNNRFMVNDLPDDEWARTIGSNLTGCFLTNRGAIKYMIPQKYGRIINFVTRPDQWAFPDGKPMHAHYSAAKAGVIAFTKALALEVAPYNITVNAFNPGIVPTAMARSGTFSDKELEEKIRMSEEGNLMARFRPARAAVEGVLFLISDAGRYTTGQVLAMG